jgi:DNA-binding transcriptional LysR family regulator
MPLRVPWLSAKTGANGITRLFSYHIAEDISKRRLQTLLSKDEYPPLPVQLLAPERRFAVPKVRAFVDFAAPRLKKYFTRPSSEANRNVSAIRSPRERVSAE